MYWIFNLFKLVILLGPLIKLNKLKKFNKLNI